MKLKTMYIDCTAGVCADMLLKAMNNMGAETDPRIIKYDEQLRYAEYDRLHAETHHHEEENNEDHGHEHHGHKSYKEIKAIIDNSPLSVSAKVQAHRIYAVIAKAEAKVHGTNVEDVHFHEVGRHEAVMNVLTLSGLVESIGADRIICSPVHDGCGFIDCSHGRIPVPVPAVMAMREDCSYIFNTENIGTEMVTPSGLAMLIGIGAVCGERPQGSIILKGIGYGERDTGLSGMEIYLIEQSE